MFIATGKYKQVIEARSKAKTLQTSPKTFHGRLYLS